MDEPSAEILSAVREIRDLVRLMAEPAIAERDRKLRTELRRIVGKSATKPKAVLLMDGSRTQSVIQRETRINQGDLSILVKHLKAYQMLDGTVSVEQVRAACKMSPNSLVALAQRCTAMGLMELRDDKKRVRLFDLDDFGLLPSNGQSAARAK